MKICVYIINIKHKSIKQMSDLNDFLKLILKIIVDNIPEEEYSEIEVLELNIFEDEKHFKTGLMNLTTGNLEDALEDFTKVIKINPQFEFIHYNRGLVFQKSNKHKEAIKDFNKELESNINNS